MNNKKRFLSNVAVTFIVMALVMLVMGFLGANKLGAQEVRKTTITAEEALVQQYGFIAAAIAFGFGAIGAGIAIGNVGSAAMGAIGEKPEIAGQALIFIALAEGLVVFGFITALMILGRL